MTWLRIDCGMPDHPVIGHLANDLRIDRDKSFALYTRTLLGFGDYRTDGFPAFVDNGTIEEWARWKGRAGKFAESFRRLCIETEDGQKDPPGRIRGWWRQDALLRKQEADRHKPSGSARSPKDSPDIPPESPRGKLGCNGYVDVDEYVNDPSTTTTRPASVDVSPIEYAQRCTMACNRGLRENPNLTGFNELVTSNQDIHQDWIKAGVPVDVAERAIYWRAIRYKPNKTRRQPTTLEYFRQIVGEAWEREQARASEGTLNPGEQPLAGKAEDEDDIMAAARRLKRQRETAGGVS